MPFDAVRLDSNFEGLFIPGLGTERYAECVVAMMEVLPRLLPTLYTKVQAKLSSVGVESRNGYDLLWQVLELSVPGFDPTVPLKQPRWGRDLDILEFGRQHKLYFRLQAKWHIYFTSRHRTCIFLKAISSSKYANIVSTLQSNIDTYCHLDNENFFPQHFRLTNVATLIHNNAKACVQDFGHPRISRVAVRDSAYDLLEDNELQFCHIQGYEPRVYRLNQGCDHGSNGRGIDRRGPNRRQGLDCRQDHPASSRDHGPSMPRGRFARPDKRHRPFMPDKQCAACKRIGHKAVNCDMLALALFVDHYVHHSLSDSEWSEIKFKWLARWKD
jgi:hypothetical protein